MTEQNAQSELPATAMTIAMFEHQIVALSEMASAEQVADALTRLQWLLKISKDLKTKLEAIMLEWVQSNGDLTIGDVRYYAGFTSTTKCTDIPGAIEALLDAVGGDFNAFCEFLASQPIKYGAAKKVLTSDVYSKFFSVTKGDSLEEGKPKKSLQNVNTRFLK